MARKDKNDSLVYRHLLSLEYEFTWDDYTDNEYVKKVLSTASKRGTGKEGFPDAIYVNENQHLLILTENKPTISQHMSPMGKEDPEKYAVDGIKHYLSFFLKNNFQANKIKEYFEHWKIVGLAISGDPTDDYNHRISTFVINNDKIEEQKGVTDILCETDYISLFENIDEERIVMEVSSSSKKINKWLRSVDSQKGLFYFLL